MQLQQPIGQPNYDFIINPAKPGRRSLFAGNSLQQRLLLVGLGLLVLIIIATVIINLLSSTSDYGPSFIAVAQEQQELIHLANQATASTQSKVSADNANLAATLQLAVTSGQSNLTSYLKRNHHKVTSQQLSARISAATDQQLAAAATAGTYDDTFKSVILAQLGQYQQALKLAYLKAQGPVGRKLLNDDYNQAQLLLTQLSS